MRSIVSCRHLIFWSFCCSYSLLMFQDFFIYFLSLFLSLFTGKTRKYYILLKINYLWVHSDTANSNFGSLGFYLIFLCHFGSQGHRGVRKFHNYSIPRTIHSVFWTTILGLLLPVLITKNNKQKSLHMIHLLAFIFCQFLTATYDHFFLLTFISFGSLSAYLLNAVRRLFCWCASTHFGCLKFVL